VSLGGVIVESSCIEKEWQLWQVAAHEIPDLYCLYRLWP
jgi:hypothetical protein